MRRATNDMWRGKEVARLASLLAAGGSAAQPTRVEAAGAGAAGMDQAQQQRCLADFKCGAINVLVATSVAEVRAGGGRWSERPTCLARRARGHSAHRRTLVPYAWALTQEGLDIGEVDLIVCFDPVSSPIRLVQRLGRTRGAPRVRRECARAAARRR